MKFEEIIIKVLNFVNMIKNIDSDKFKFKFSSVFFKKIENLEIILEIYTGNQTQAVKNLTELYNNYQKYTIEQNKININNMSKQDYKKLLEEEFKKDELDTVPKNQRIYKTKDLRKLYIMYYYCLFFAIICLYVLIIYFIILYIWINYSRVKTNLYSIVSKNLDLEISLYKAINSYGLIIFNNLTIDELAKDVFYAPEKNIYDKVTLLNSFYDDLFIAFDYEVEITILRKNFKNFPFFNFTCENLYEYNHDYLLELTNFSSALNITDIKNNLIEICLFYKADEYNDMNVVFQKHYQEIQNAITSIEDFSFEGIIAHLKEGKLGKVVAVFNCVLIYLLHIISNRMHKIEVDDLISLLKQNLGITLFFTFFSYFILILLVRLFFIRRLKIYCNQVILLKKIFKISEIQE